MEIQIYDYIWKVVMFTHLNLSLTSFNLYVKLL